MARETYLFLTQTKWSVQVSQSREILPEPWELQEPQDPTSP